MLEKKPSTVLVFEDEDISYELMAASLEKIGWRVVRAPHTGRELTQVHDSLFHCDVVVLDIMLDPTLDAVEVLKQLASRGFKGTLVVVSANAKKMLEPIQSLAEAYNIKVAAAIEKPVDWEDLQRVIGTPVADDRK